MRAKLTNWNTARAEILKRLRNDLLRETSSETAILRQVASKTRGLPVYGDVGGCLILTEDGKVLFLEFALEDQDEIVSGEFDDEEWLRHAWSKGARKFPHLFSELQVLWG